MTVQKMIRKTTIRQKMTMTKIMLLLTALVSASGCAMRSPQGNDQSNGNSFNDVRPEMQNKRQSVKMINEPGMIHIQRHTKEYSISMVLDASDENIYFVMDLPQEEIETEILPVVEEPPAEEEPVVEETVAEEPVVEEPPVVEEEKAAKPELDETRASKYVLYAQTYFLEKKYARALEEVNRALGYSPNSAVAHSLKGSIYFKLNEKDLAKGSWEKALKLDESLDNVKQMLEKLDKS